MTDNEKLTAGYDMLYLVRCALAGMTADLSHLSGELSAAYGMAKFHSLTSLCSFALDGASGADDKAYRAFCEARHRTIMQSAMYDIERGELLQFCEASGIRYMTLKGIIIREMYPNVAMRQMADNDIWFDKAYQKEIAEWFSARGYETVLFDKNNHDVYQKAPFFNFEMHTSLYNKADYKDLYRYYENKCGALLSVDKTNFGVRFSDEDFYIYVVGHAAKHHEGCGTGLRSLTDIYLMSKHFASKLDRSYVDREMTKLGFADFEREAVELANTIFSDARLPEGTAREMLESIFLCGTYGNIENNVQNRLKKMSKSDSVTVGARIRYLLWRLFPPRVQMERLYGAKNVFLLPFAYVRRFFKQCFPKAKQIRRELRVLLCRKDLSDKQK